MAKKRRKKSKQKFPLVTTAILATVAAQSNSSSTNLSGKTSSFVRRVTGYNTESGTWSLNSFMQGGAPLIGVPLARKALRMFGVRLSGFLR